MNYNIIFISFRSFIEPHKTYTAETRRIQDIYSYLKAGTDKLKFFLNNIQILAQDTFKQLRNERVLFKAKRFSTIQSTVLLGGQEVLKGGKTKGREGKERET